MERKLDNVQDKEDKVMKANEAPEKIYIDANENWLRTYTVYTEKAKGNDIEYTRTDAFIEKALVYLNSKFYFHNAFYGVVSTDFNAMEEMFEDFRKYMEGE